MTDSQEAGPGNPPRRPEAGRAAQKRRTRAAIVEATARLIAGGHDPSVDDIAAEADVSRRTVYMHFPTVDQLVLDATAGALSAALVDAALDENRGGDAETAVDGLVRALLATVSVTLPLGRKIIALTVDAPAPAHDGPRRGYRRVGWIENALEPAREQLGPERYDRLLSALTVIIGWEAMVVLRDVRDLTARQEEETLRWAATALVRAALAE